MRTLGPALSFAAALTLPLGALAQKAAAPAPTTSPPTSAAAASATAAASAPIPLPLPPSVDDPMLTAIAAPTRVVGSWDDALTLIRARSTDLRIAVNEVRRAEAQSRTALAGALFNLNLNANGIHQLITNDTGGFTTINGNAVPTTTVPIPNTASGSLGINQPLLALATWHAIKTAGMAEDAARLSVDDAKRTIALNVANALVGVVTAERVAELNRIGLRRALERLSITRRRTELGGGTGLDVVRSQQDVEVARATLVNGDESLRKAREALGLAVGLPEQVGVTPNLNLDALEAGAGHVCHPAGNLEDRPDLAALKKRAEVANRNVDNVKLQFAPTINATSQISTSSISSPTAPQTLWNIGAVFSWNIWEGGARYGALRNNRALEDTALQNLEATRRTATVQVVQAQRAVTVAQQALKVAQDARSLAAEVERLTRTGYQEGRGTSLELVVAAGALREAEITLALREFDLVRARILALLAQATCPW